MVKRTTKEIYSYFRLRDSTPFGAQSPVKLKFGGPDTRSIKFFDKLDGYYFSTFTNNQSSELKDFLKSEYLEKGAALFGRGTPEDLADFRKAAGGKLDNLNDYRVETIVHSSVQRVRNYAHINSLRQARIKRGKIVAIVDQKTSEICRFLNGKYIDVATAAEAVDRFSKMEPGEYALELFKSEQGKAFAKDPVGYVQDRIGKDGEIDPAIVAEGRGFPPYHPRCRTRVEGVIAK